MYGIMPLEEYVANYDSILENKPFKFGNMKGKVLNKSKFFNDYSDYEILLRNEIPDKYFKYFNDDSDIDIEFGRSTKINLSPIKNHLDNGVKDSQVIFKKESNVDSNIASTSTVKAKESVLEDDDTKQFKLDLGDLNMNKKENQRKVSTKDSEIDDLNIDDLYEKTFKLLNKNSLVDNEGKQLNRMIQTLLENMKSMKLENEKLSNNSNNLKLIVKDLNGLINSYKFKLKEYYQDNKMLKAKLNQMDKPSKPSTTQRHVPIIEEESDDDLDSIDRQIRSLQLKKEKLIERTSPSKSTPQSSVEQISNEIIQKVMQQLQTHKEDHKEVPKSQSQHTHTTFNDHSSCPFCNPVSKDSANNILFSKVLNPEANIKLDDFIDILADRFKYKMNNDGTSGPEIW